MSRLSRIMLAVIGVLLLAVAGLSWALIRSGDAEGLQAMAEGRVVMLNVGEAALAPKPAPKPPAQAAAQPSEPQAEGNAPASAPAVAATSGADLSAPLSIPAGKPLAAAPAADITEETDLGPLPWVSKTGIQPWHYYWRPYALKPGKPMIAVLVTGLGFARALAEDAVRMPPQVDLAFSPYGPASVLWAASARAVGHEIFVELPVEPDTWPAADAGPHGLLTVNSPAENLLRLRWVMTRIPGYVGLYLPPHEKLTASAEAAAPLLQFIASRGVMLAMANQALPEAAERILAPLVLPTVRANVFLSGENADDLTRQLLQTEDAARRHGRAFLVAPANPLALKMLTDWVQQLEKKGYSLAPVTALARIPNS